MGSSVASICRDLRGECQFQSESRTHEAHGQEVIVYGSLGKTLKVVAGILLVPLKYSNAKILQVVRDLITIRSTAIVNM